MKILIEVEEKHPRTTMTPMELTTIGDQAWIVIRVGDAVYEIDYWDFHRAAKALKTH